MNQRGSALVEFSVVALFVGVFASALLGLCYLLGARALLEFRTEQALYCLAEGKGVARCRRTFEENIRNTLPFGRLAKVAVNASARRWRVECTWNLDAWWNFRGAPVQLRIRKFLTPELLRRRGALRS